MDVHCRTVVNHTVLPHKSYILHKVSDVSLGGHEINSLEKCVIDLKDVVLDGSQVYWLFDDREVIREV